MKSYFQQNVLTISATALCVLFSGCGKKVVPAPAAPTTVSMIVPAAPASMPAPVMVASKPVQGVREKNAPSKSVAKSAKTAQVAVTNSANVATKPANVAAAAPIVGRDADGKILGPIGPVLNILEAARGNAATPPSLAASIAPKLPPGLAMDAGGTPGLAGGAPGMPAAPGGVAAGAPAAPAVPAKPPAQCFVLSFHHKAMASHATDEDCLQHRNLLQLHDSKLNPATLCVRVNGKPVKYSRPERDQLVIAPVAGPKSTITVSYCVAKAKCAEDCTIPKDEFLAAIGGDEADAKAPAAVWDSEDAAEAEATDKAAKAEAEVRKELGDGGDETVFSGWTSEEAKPACERVPAGTAAINDRTNGDAS
jgi:hypothetical protein